MRIVKEDAGEYQAGRTYVDITSCYAIKDTIEISDTELDEIGWKYYNECWDEYKGWTKGLAQYLKELIKLKEKVK
jgi:hypothetical protein